MLTLDKNTVDFLVTSNMAVEVGKFIEYKLGAVSQIADELIDQNIDTFYFVGCGSSKAVGQAAQYLINKYSSARVNVYTGWEFVNHCPKALSGKSAVVLISHSGTTEEVVEALRLAKQRHAYTIAIVNHADKNPLGEEARAVIDYNAHAMWECQLVAVYQLVGKYIAGIAPDPEMDQILLQIPRLPDVLRQLIVASEGKALALARNTADWKGFYTVAGGPLVPLAYKEGVITNMEFAWGHGAVIESGEFRHGPLEITDKNVPFVFLVGTDASRNVTQRALEFAQRYNANCIVFDYQEYGMGLHSDLAPLVMFVPLEWFSYYFSIIRDHNPDDRRYYGKVKY